MRTGLMSVVPKLFVGAFALGLLACGGRGLSHRNIQRVVSTHSRELRTCYETELLSNPAAHGTLFINFTVDPSGAVVNPSVAEDQVQSPSLASCVLGAFATWRFPVPRRYTNIERYPLEFERD